MSHATGQRKSREAPAAALTVHPGVARALADLRRGACIVLCEGGEGDKGVVVAAAENADRAPAAIKAAGGVPMCILPGTRAKSLSVSATASVNAAVPCAGEEGSLNVALVHAIAGVSDEPVDLASRPAVESNALQDAAVELVKLARLIPAALLADIDGGAREFAVRNDMLIVEPGEVAAYRKFIEDGALVQTTHASVPLEGAVDSEIYAFRPLDGGKEHLAIVIGQPDADGPVLARIHSECFTGDLLGSLRCDCGEQLRGAIQAISEQGGGVLLYLAQEGRGIGLVNKLRTYRLQDDGFDTIDANQRLGFDADERVYKPAVTMLRALGYERVRLLTNNPAKVEGMAGSGIEVVERVPHAFPANGHNDQYLRTKAARAGHLL